MDTQYSEPVIASDGHPMQEPVSAAPDAGGMPVWSFWDSFQFALAFTIAEYVGARLVTNLVPVLPAALQWLLIPVVHQAGPCLLVWALCKPWGSQIDRVVQTYRPGWDASLLLILLAVPFVFVVEGLSRLGQVILPDVFPLSLHVELGPEAVLSMALVVPVTHEVLFRGILGRSLMIRYGPRRGMLLGALLYGVSRLQPSWIIPGMMAGLIFQTVYELTGSIWAPIGLHALANFFAFAPALVNDDYSPVCLTACVATAGYLYLLLALYSPGRPLAFFDQLRPASTLPIDPSAPALSSLSWRMRSVVSAACFPFYFLVFEYLQQFLRLI